MNRALKVWLNRLIVLVLLMFGVVVLIVTVEGISLIPTAEAQTITVDTSDLPRPQPRPWVDAIGQHPVYSDELLPECGSSAADHEPVCDLTPWAEAGDEPLRDLTSAERDALRRDYQTRLRIAIAAAVAEAMAYGTGG